MKFYGSNLYPHHPNLDRILEGYSLRDIKSSRVPEWASNDTYTEDQKELACDIMSELIDEYISAWNDKVKEYYGE